MTVLHFAELQLATPEWLTQLRMRAEDLARAKDWAGLSDLRDELRRDGQMWVDYWAPRCAIAARNIGDPGARALLDEAISAGFGQPGLFGGELEAAFGAEPDWADIATRLAGNTPSAPLEILEWPTITPAPPLTLFRLPEDREGLLRRRIPDPAGNAWDTALRLLGWVTNRWEHSPTHMDIDDAVACLDRVDAGERFACVEYSLVLSQALNAVGIPARRLKLHQPDYHVGLGRQHVVSEAWIDDLAAWVVLDGQNGSYWADAEDNPLGVVDLRRLSAGGGPMPTMVAAPGAATKAAEDIAVWFTYFASTTIATGVESTSWATDGFVPIFLRNWLVDVARLERDPGRLYPDLSELGIGIGLADGQAAVSLRTTHPYPAGFVARHAGGTDQVALDDPVWALPTEPGEHAVELAVRTRYGNLPGRRLRYVVR